MTVPGGVVGAGDEQVDAAVAAGRGGGRGAGGDGGGEGPVGRSCVSATSPSRRLRRPKSEVHQERVEVYGGTFRWRALRHYVREDPLGHHVEIADLDAVPLAQLCCSLRLHPRIWPQRGRRREPY